MNTMMSQVGEPPESRLSGLLTRDLPNGTTRWYTNLEREVELLGETRDIFLPNVTCADSGVYMCHLAAPVGEQNREGQVLLTLTGTRPKIRFGVKGLVRISKLSQVSAPCTMKDSWAFKLESGNFQTPPTSTF